MIRLELIDVRKPGREYWTWHDAGNGTTYVGRGKTLAAAFAVAWGMARRGQGEQ